MSNYDDDDDMQTNTSPGYVPPCDRDENLHAFGSDLPAHFVIPRRLQTKSSELIETVNDWHFAMINDLPRNQFYQSALQRVVDEKSVVLEIGAGTGLLSMMAAQAGAKRVIAIEANPDIAQLARQIIAMNGLSHKIHVINEMSTHVNASDLPEVPNVLVSEILGTFLLGESTLHYVEDARQRLLAPNSTIIPGRGRQFIQLVESEDISRITSARNWNGLDGKGLDLRAFNLLQDTTSFVFTKQYGFRFSSCPHRLMSDPIEVLNIDFTTDSIRTAFPREQRIPFVATKTGTAHVAMAFWDVQDSHRNGSSEVPLMSTDPRATEDNFCRDMQWGQALQLLEEYDQDEEKSDSSEVSFQQPQPLLVTEGEQLELVVRISRSGVTMQVAVERVNA